ncbi:MAG: hypothetical protein RTU30_04680 [Candidatus Thorarchaeota archaeon]
MNSSSTIFALITIPLAFVCAAMGIILGAILRNSVCIVPIAATTSIVYWMIGGGITPLSLLGIRFGVANSYSPISNAYSPLIEMFIDGTHSTLLIDFSMIAGFAIIFVIVFSFLAERIAQVDYSQRIREIKKRAQERRRP